MESLFGKDENIEVSIYFHIYHIDISNLYYTILNVFDR